MPGRPAAGAIIATRGLDAEVRGIKKNKKRPDLIIIDDPDTEQTVSSELQSKKLEKRIERGLAFAGGQQKRVARVMLTTLQSRDVPLGPLHRSDPKAVLAGQALPLPGHQARRGWTCGKNTSPCASKTRSPATNTPAAPTSSISTAARIMDDGAKVANPNRFNPEKRPDGSQTEVSALQCYFNEVARVGQEAVSTEWDNDPPEESGPQESGLTAYRVQRQVSGFPAEDHPARLLAHHPGHRLRQGDSALGCASVEGGRGRLPGHGLHDRLRHPGRATAPRSAATKGSTRP